MQMCWLYDTVLSYDIIERLWSVQEKREAHMESLKSNLLLRRQFN